MTASTTRRVFGVCLLALALGLAGCSDKGSSDNSQTNTVDNAEQQLEQANRNLQQAQQNLADAKAQSTNSKDTVQPATETPAAHPDKTAKTADTAKPKKTTTAKTEHSSPKSSEPTHTAATSSNDTRSESVPDRQARAEPQPPVCNDCGTVTSIVPVKQSEGGSGVGAVAGGVAGGALGSQIGHGTGKTIALIAGTLGGAYAGNYAEGKIRKSTAYQVNVAMDSGGTRQVTLDTAGGLSDGTRVRVVGNSVALLQ